MELALPPEWVADLPTDRPLTADDVLRLPEGPPFFELIAGEIVVSPPAIPAHSRAIRNLFLALHEACPSHLEVFPNEVDWVVDQSNVFEPDVIVVPRANVGEKRLSGPPVLAVEILSPRTRKRDLTVKREKFAEGGCPAYWIVDLKKGPELTVLELDPAAGRYVEVARIAGDGVHHATIPYPVDIDVARLQD
ncbi:MAG TPA: Uma2 family endonuclease [Acidimicrobiales bacterium]